MAKIKEMKGFVQICEDACIALGELLPSCKIFQINALI